MNVPEYPTGLIIAGNCRYRRILFTDRIECLWPQEHTGTGNLIDVKHVILGSCICSHSARVKGTLPVINVTLAS